jgi:hypothetical protein
MYYKHMQARKRTRKGGKPVLEQGTEKKETQHFVLALDREVHRKLKIKAAEGGTTVRALIDEAIAEYLQKGGKK